MSGTGGVFDVPESTIQRIHWVVYKLGSNRKASEFMVLGEGTLSNVIQAKKAGPLLLRRIEHGLSAFEKDHPMPPGWVPVRPNLRDAKKAAGLQLNRIERKLDAILEALGVKWKENGDE